MHPLLIAVYTLHSGLSGIPLRDKKPNVLVGATPLVYSALRYRSIKTEHLAPGRVRAGHKHPRTERSHVLVGSKSPTRVVGLCNQPITSYRLPITYILVPHSGQNLAPFASAPQLGHLPDAAARSIFVPQLGQNFAPPVAVPHFGQASAAG
ncbi:hypothetical protein ANRL1_01898 [Anaerolineae bacterium]|nr:hypothetical protein ANRL1_01898 [Anaerolineae bacterium]